MAHYNKIIIARGTRDGYLRSETPAYGELFFDGNSGGLYIGQEDNTFKRFGGFDAVILKGVITNSDFSTITDNAEFGDARLVVGPINVVKTEPEFDNNGNLVSGKTNKRTYDDYYKSGTMLIYVDGDVSDFYGSYPVYNGDTCIAGWIAVGNGINTATEVEYDPEDTDLATGITDVQTALDYLFNNKLEIRTEFVTNITVDSSANFSTESDILEYIKDLLNIKSGEGIVYTGNNVTITANDGSELTIQKNTLITNKDGVITVIPLGSDAVSIDFELHGSRPDTEIPKTYESIDTSGNPLVDQTDSDVATLQQAIDMLYQTSAYVNSNGKIPTNLIPTTLIGALQYIGTYACTSNMTDIQLAQAIEHLENSWETDDSEEGTGTNYVKNHLDPGDYAIITTDSNTNNIPEEVYIEYNGETGGGLWGLATFDNNTAYYCNTIYYLGIYSFVDATGYIWSVSCSNANCSVEIVTMDVNGTTKYYVKLTVPSSETDIDVTITLVRDATTGDSVSVSLKAKGVARSWESFNITDVDGVLLFSVDNGDHVIVNEVEYDGDDIVSVKFDLLTNEVAVNSINNLQGNIFIEGNTRDGCPELQTSTDIAEKTLYIKAPYAVLEVDPIEEDYFAVATGNRFLKQSDLYIINSTDTDDEYGTGLGGKNSEGEDIKIYWPEISGRIQIELPQYDEDDPEYNEENRAGDEYVMARFNTDGYVTDSQVKNQNGSLAFGEIGTWSEYLYLNFIERTKLFEFPEEEVSYTFDGMNSNTTDRENAENIHLILDDRSTIDGGVWL